MGQGAVQMQGAKRNSRSTQHLQVAIFSGHHHNPRFLGPRTTLAAKANDTDALNWNQAMHGPNAERSGEATITCCCKVGEL